MLLNGVRWGGTIPMTERLNYEHKLVIKQGRLYLAGIYLGEEREFPLIYRDTPIIGGVYAGQNSREAIFVGTNSFALDNLLSEVKLRASDRKVITKGKILPAIFDTVKAHMSWNDSTVNKIVSQGGFVNDKIISLGDFIRAGEGVCRHHALACGALAERGKYDRDLVLAGKQLSGTPSIDRNIHYLSGHAWLRYTSNNGQVAILDVAQDFIGVLDKTTMEKIKSEKLWPYNRPTDKF